MRGGMIGLVVVAVGLLGLLRAQAGVYTTAEPMPTPELLQGGVQPLGFARFRNFLADSLNIGAEQPANSRRQHYLARRDELLARARSARLTTEETVNLSEYLIRLRQYEEAVQLLTPLAAQERGNFMVLANLGTAHQLSGRLDRALGYLEQVSLAWPKRWPGLSPAQLEWYRLAEKYQLRLVRSRLKESLRQSGKRASYPQGLDELFGSEQRPVRFVAETGRYEAGKLAAVERAKLPSQALALVQQLLFWLPGATPGMEDTRLYWLLGELYNADGDVAAASQILEKCVWSHRFDAPDLREHRKIVQAARPAPAPVAALPSATLPSPATVPPDESSWIPDRRKLLIGGAVAALVIVGLVYLQVREFFRRRRRT